MTTLHPLTDLTRFQKDVDRLLTDVLGPRTREARWSPRLDLTETEAAFTVRLDLPGVAKDAVEITFEEDVLTVRGERTRAKAEDTTFHRVERIYGAFERSLRFTRPVNADAIEATFEQGVLTITVPKAEEAKPRQISIQ